MNNTRFNSVQGILLELTNKSEQGEINPLQAWGEINLIEKELKAVKSQIEDMAKEEAEMHPEKSFSYAGFTFEKRNGGYSYYYDDIPQYNSLKAEMKKVEAQAKTAFQLYQKTGSRPISEDGELLPLPEVKPRKDSLVVKVIPNK